MKVCHTQARGCDLDRQPSRGRVLQEEPPLWLKVRRIQDVDIMGYIDVCRKEMLWSVG